MAIPFDLIDVRGAVLNGVPGPGSAERRPADPQQAAEQFEQILVKQMVETMTKNLFEGGLAGDDAPQWLGAYNDMQSDVLATELAHQMTRNGKLGIAELLMKQWARQSETAGTPASGTDSTSDPS